MIPDIVNQMEVTSSLPPSWSAPRRLQLLEGNCGVVAAWGILRRFHRSTSSAHLIRACRHTKKHGTFVIALAVGLREHGLSVDFYSDFDPAPNAIERRCYRIAEKMGIRVSGGVDLEDILSGAAGKSIAVALYNTDSDVGHISPILPLGREHVHLPYAEEPEKEVMSREEFMRRWTAPEIYRQSLIVSR